MLFGKDSPVTQDDLRRLECARSHDRSRRQSEL